MNPADSPTLFALDASQYALRLHAQDAATMMLATGNVLQSSTEAYEVVRFRTEVPLVDSNGVAVPNYPVSLTVAPNYSACEIWAAGSIALTPGNTAQATYTAPANPAAGTLVMVAVYSVAGSVGIGVAAITRAAQTTDAAAA